MTEPRYVRYDEVRDMRDQILREMHEGFKGVYARQDKTNGRIDSLQVQGGEHDARLGALEHDREAFYLHRRSTDPPPPAPLPAKVDAEDKPVTRLHVALVLATVGAVAAAWTWLVGQIKSGRLP